MAGIQEISRKSFEKSSGWWRPHVSIQSTSDTVFKKHGLHYEVAMEVGGWEVIKKYVELDLGISIFMSICITGDEKLSILPASRFFPNRTYGIVLRKGKILSPQARRFMELLLHKKRRAVAEDH
ncbi:MAG: LysR family transcriptional regulator substrate-binding protein [Candidatus Hydrogenedentes bacterium]|nr:LysR family transcriptional regulator substrate-binding protein [Candidatus Hydrogenedentota bacterium]